MKEYYDVVIIGSGMGGLVAANILAREGKSVCVLEKNNQFGGNLQTFVRDKTIFDTGVHYLGGLSKGQNLYRYFDYLDILDGLQLKKLDKDGFDLITFDDDDEVYPHAQGFENFINNLVEKFPEEKKAIRTYCNKLKEVCKKFPLYNLKTGKPYHEDATLFGLGAKAYIDSLTANEKLKAVLAGSNMLYAGDPEKTPFYVHALSVNSFIESAYRCADGGSQITKLLVRKLKTFGGDAVKHQEVTHINVADNRVTSVTTKKGNVVHGGLFISNIEPKRTLKLTDDGHFRKSFARRIEKMEGTISAFSVHLTLKPKSFKYLNHNYYHFKDKEAVWNAPQYTQKNWPLSYMVSMGTRKNQDKWADQLSAIAYMRFEEVAPWADTFNTVANKNDRGESYKEFKLKKTEIFLNELEKKFPDIRNCIHAIYTSTPLSYRDYIGSVQGSMYGHTKDANNPLKSFISPRTKIENLFFTGQSLNMHGILGVTISGVLTCSEILGGKYLLDKIVNSKNKVPEKTRV